MRAILSILGIFVALLFAQPTEVPKGAKCVVCGMDALTDPKFTSQIKLKNGKYLFTESPKHALRYWLENKDKVAEVWVKDFSTGKWIDGKRAYYVLIEEGPMGKDLAPFKSLLSAKKFAKGKKVYRASELTLEFLKELDMDMGHGGMKHSH